MKSRLRIELAALALLAPAITGCVTRTYTIETEPSEADIYVAGKHLGKSPVKREFTFYGPREVTIRKKGYTARTERMALRTPLYQRFPIDFVPEVLYPGKIRVEKRFLYTLEPVTEEASSDLVPRAQEARKQLANVPLDPDRPGAIRGPKKGRGRFPYPARQSSWWLRR